VCQRPIWDVAHPGQTGRSNTPVGKTRRIRACHLVRWRARPVDAAEADPAGHDETFETDADDRVSSSRIPTMADIAFNCPQCGHSYRFAANLVGKRGRCKACQAVFRIAEPSAASTILTPAAMRPKPAPPPDDGRVAFNCPTCGHPYRLDANLAGKQGRCTSCRGIFTIPSRSDASTPRPDHESSRTAWPPAHPGGRRTSPPAMAQAAGDSGWWELDSDESIPAVTAGPVAARPRAASAASVAPARPALSRGRPTPVHDDDDGPIVTAKPVRPKWVLYASIAAGTLVGAFAYAMTYSLVSNALGPAPPPLAEQPKAQPTQAVADTDEDGEETEPDADSPAPQVAGAATQHREAVDALTRAYQKIADGYARIRDADSIAQGSGPVAQAVAELQAASRRGKALPPLAPPIARR
jgi:transcription elongation factor Elf1